MTFDYEAFPTQAMYFVNWDFSKEIDSPEEVNGQIWTQGQGRYTSNWLPSFDDVNEKVIFNLSINYDKKYMVVGNGFLIDQAVRFNSTVTEPKEGSPGGAVAI